jgi:hypothetical protein
MSSPDLQYAQAVAGSAITERARLEMALMRLFVATGSFGAVVAVTGNCLQRLAARVRAEGGDTGGWVG